MPEITSDEKLALLIALDKTLKPQLDDAKQNAKYDLMGMFEENGADRKAIMCDGQKVGEVGLSYSTAKPIVKPGCEQDFIEYLDQLGLVERVPVKGWEKHFTGAGETVLDAESGEIVDCMQWEPSRVRTAAVRGCKPDDVLKALGNKLQGTNPLALLEE